MALSHCGIMKIISWSKNFIILATSLLLNVVLVAQNADSITLVNAVWNSDTIANGVVLKVIFCADAQSDMFASQK